MDYTNSEVSEELIYLVRKTLRDALTINVPSLWDVATLVVQLLRVEEGGNWICDIRPEEVDSGLNFHKSKYIRMKFDREDIKYCVVVA